MSNNITSSNKSDKTVLIIEDDAPDMALVKRKVQNLWPSCTVIPVKSLREAYEEYQKQDFDMVLLDLNLPDSEGPQTVSDMRKINAKVPIIVITSIAKGPAIDESLKRGANIVVAKADVTDHDFMGLMDKDDTE